MLTYCYLNGAIIPFKNASLPLNDLGVLRGYGIFDYIRARNGKFCFIDRHIDRFFGSAKKMGLQVPITKEKLFNTLTELIQKNKDPNAHARIVLTGGESSNGISKDGEENMYILFHEDDPFPGEVYTEGVKLMTIPYQRDLVDIKTLNYAPAVKNQAQQKKEEAFEILYTPDGCITEASRANFFLWNGDVLVTPKEGILHGITRDVVLELAQKDYKIEEREVKIGELESATEAFITATGKDIVPVVKVDNMVVGDGKVGRNTQKLMDLYLAAAKE
ncbi:MAG: amino acid aminotransferase [Candidatus Jacksonbacteria bacterium]|jgi:branched-chain amino acid aminotransferase|nr:amino acid aminotransferase [Candidatus Jacksonbacteria bacterium]MBT6034258.1 amino acid aminotransferase [Candidatus Jacksonbacteria bacterium]MBT6301332.1 amino acid aminotransferase [Candidatus Jacksonbacteria bacterium]MBT6756974.1 amino acid aminotransferase [Candidatus Jacksonbacteria bacterium]MBT6955251.1 amino acid aminotransferase [Candidatus Jacksonbacteria bacterium]